MAKRYYQNKKDRKNESKGMKEYYAGKEMRDRMDYDSGMMIREDKGAIANLPQNVMIKAYPSVGGYNNYNVADTIMGIDTQMRDDSRKEKTERYPEKY